MDRPFSSSALAKCYDRYAKARRALKACSTAIGFDDFASSWSEYLIHTGSVLNALDAGSKLTPHGRQWYGGVKREGRNDPLVRYFHQARNVEEHALQPTMENAPTSIGIGAPQESVYIRELVPDAAFFSNPHEALRGKAWRTSDGKPPTIFWTPGGPKLLAVNDDRYGEVFPPPTEHKGKPLDTDDPRALAETYLEYLAELISKAEELS